MRIGIPQRVSFEILQKELRKRHGQRVTNGFASWHEPGTGCPCEDCANERKAMLAELSEKIHADYKREVHDLCPQRAAHDLNKQENPAPPVETPPSQPRRRTLEEAIMDDMRRFLGGC